MKKFAIILLMGGVPATQKDIEEFDWLSEDGKDAIVLDGLPRLLI